MADIAERLSRARARLLLDHCFFGVLALKLRVEQKTAGCPTIQTDGTVLEYNPEWCAQWSDAQLEGLWAHEVMHCAMGHPWRRNGREGQTWNVACDIAINQQIRASGIQLPPTELQDKEQQYSGWHAEAIYAKEKQDQQQQGTPPPTPDFGQDVQDAPDTGEEPSEAPSEDTEDGPSQDGQGTAGQGQDEPGQPENGSSDDAPLTEFDWQIETEVAMMAARRAGQMPGGAERLIHEERAAKVDWKTLLRRFVEQQVPNDYTWQRPNRRYIGEGLYLPGLTKENLPRLAIFVDTSGSIPPAMLEAGQAELNDIMQELKPAGMDVVYVDAEVQGQQSFEPDGEPLVLEPKGGGGTAFSPAFNWLAEQEQQYAAAIYFTDLECFDTPKEPEIPVLWIVPEWTQAEWPWGETVHMAGLA